MKRIKDLNKKQRKQIQSGLRAVIQLLYFLFLPSAYTAAFAGVKYIFTRLGTGEAIGWTPFVAVLVVLCAYTVIFGRFFCGFACAFGSLGDAIRALYVAVCRRIRKKPAALPAKWAKKLSVIKYFVLTTIVLLCFTGVYGKTQGTSPWDVFSMLHAGNFRLGGYVPGLILLAVIVVGMAVQERFFCRFLCPMGAVFSLLPVFPLFSLRRDRESCIKGCSACTRKCPSDVELPERGSWEIRGDCFQCQKCIGTCPKGNIHCGIHGLRGNEEWFTILRAVILLLLFLWLGI